MSNELRGRRTKGQCWKDVTKYGDRPEFPSREPVGYKPGLDSCSEMRCSSLRGRRAEQASAAPVACLQTPGAGGGAGGTVGGQKDSGHQEPRHFYLEAVWAVGWGS